MSNYTRLNRLLITFSSYNFLLAFDFIDIESQFSEKNWRCYNFLECFKLSTYIFYFFKHLLCSKMLCIWLCFYIYSVCFLPFWIIWSQISYLHVLFEYSLVFNVYLVLNMYWIMLQWKYDVCLWYILIIYHLKIMTTYT